MVPRSKRSVVRQEVHWVSESRTLDLPVKPYRVWTLFSETDSGLSDDPTETPSLPISPKHNNNCFMEDHIHD